MRSIARGTRLNPFVPLLFVSLASSAPAAEPVNATHLIGGDKTGWIVTNEPDPESPKGPRLVQVLAVRPATASAPSSLAPLWTPLRPLQGDVQLVAATRDDLY